MGKLVYGPLPAATVPYSEEMIGNPALRKLAEPELPVVETKLQAKNPRHQHLVEVSTESRGYYCGDCLAEGRGYVSLAAREDCVECHGTDDYGHDFCPVCEFCCGC
jgi:hypothetical protein